MRRKFIGLSLSLCMQDILAGKIEVKDIAAIVTSTAFLSIHQAFEYYYLNYWSDYSSEYVAKTLSEVWQVVCQPRLQVEDIYSHRGHTVGHGFWLNTETGELKGHF